MGAVHRIKAEVAAASERDRALVEEIASFLASQNNDDVVPFYTRQADEIMAMVRERDRT